MMESFRDLSVRTTVRELVEAPELAGALRLCAGAEGAGRELTHPRIQKSGLVLAGHLHGVVATRIQIFGETELTYFASLDASLRQERAHLLFSLSPSLVVLTRDAEAPSEFLAEATRTGSPLAIATERSSACIARLHGTLDRLLAPRTWRHGVLVEVFNVGILLSGPSGIGKSESALFLVERGHRLVADDRVELARKPDGTVIGTPAPLLRHHLEIRGLGILNVRDLYGATAVRDEAEVSLLVELRSFEELETVDRLGVDEETGEVLGRHIPLVRIPVRPGRDMGVLLEVAARNELLKRAGHHAARAFVERLQRETLK